MSLRLGRLLQRVDEALLLALAAGVTLAAALPLQLLQPEGIRAAGLMPPLALIGLFVVLHLALLLRGWRADPIVLPVLLVLMGLSLALQQRLAPALASRQLTWLLLGAAIVGLACHAPLPWRLLRRYRYTWASLGLALVGLTLVFGRSPVSGGPELWLGLGPLVFQPAELLKLLLVIFLAGYLADKQELLVESSIRLGPLRLMPLGYVAPLAVVLGACLALLAVQGDLGAALLLFCTTLGMLYLASLRAAYVVGGLAVFAGGSWLLFERLAIVQQRIALWLDPWSDPQGGGYQLIQALMAIAAGGVTGTGIGLGAPTSIPAVHTDFVYAALVEELGLAGAAALVLLYALLVLRGFRVAILARTPYAQLLAGGLALSLGVQALVIIGGVLRLIPLTGITLPFLSYGGTSIVTSAAAVGLLLRLSAEAA
ncbi:MAG: FtsW/RodA/SpoVE family cell cycle protein [Caldilineae bacterium]|nr:FtsW/RodA/SpoVE family cell cycle protein [Chloroflexota bacterium]MCB9177725.1 FtsW/RodA/SpoVE family cell cycle protein [Caldilineae bacterium]